MSTPELANEPASFRDPSSRIFYEGERVLRGLDKAASADWELLATTRFFRREVEAGRIVATTEVATADVFGPDSQWDRVLEHERLPFVSYPYEWTFGMLRDAAALHLDLLLASLDEGMTTKDGYAYNVQWRGAAPVFIDVPSFQRSPGGPWAGYRQFCETFLCPLMLQAYTSVPFQPWLRGSVNGIPPTQLRRLLPARDLGRPGVLKHVLLQSAMESRVTGGAQALQDDLRSAGFSQELSKATVRGLRKLVARLRRPRATSHWSKYRGSCSYSDEDRAAKEACVERVAIEQRPSLALDLGCNDGRYATLLARHSDWVVAVDADECVVDECYERLRRERVANVLPLVMDLADPSPGIGWRGVERLPFADRAAPDLVLALALLHHLVIAGNVPMAEVVDWLRSFDARVVVEFVGPDDPMAQRLLANKPAGQHDDYELDVFERLLHARFDVDRREALPSGTRTMFVATPRG